MGTITKKISDIINQLCIFLITLYQYTLSPLLGLLGCHCRFHPSCSAYARIALENYSLFQSLYLIIKRVGRCNPFFEGGLDPVVLKNINKG